MTAGDPRAWCECGAGGFGDKGLPALLGTPARYLRPRPNRTFLSVLRHRQSVRVRGSILRAAVRCSRHEGTSSRDRRNDRRHSRRCSSGSSKPLPHRCAFYVIRTHRDGLQLCGTGSGPAASLRYPAILSSRASRCALRNRRNPQNLFVQATTNSSWPTEIMSPQRRTRSHRDSRTVRCVPEPAFEVSSVGTRPATSIQRSKIRARELLGSRTVQQRRHRPLRQDPASTSLTH